MGTAGGTWLADERVMQPAAIISAAPGWEAAGRPQFSAGALVQMNGPPVLPRGTTQTW